MTKRKFPKKVCLVEEPKICMEATRRNLQAPLTIPKKLLERQIKQLERKISQKKVFLVPQKCKGAKNLYGSCSTEFAGSTQNHKIIGTSNQPIKMKMFKVCLVP
jgi:hypothetical protein